MAHGIFVVLFSGAGHLIIGSTADRRASKLHPFIRRA
jgi:hypothetical protein